MEPDAHSNRELDSDDAEVVELLAANLDTKALRGEREAHNLVENSRSRPLTAFELSRCRSLLESIYRPIPRTFSGGATRQEGSHKWCPAKG